MADYPTIAGPTGLKQRFIKPTHASVSAAGYTTSRARATVGKWAFDALHTALPSADVTTLQGFFDDNQGGAFNWPHPETNVTYIVLFVDDELSFEWMDGDYWKVTVKLREV